MTIKKTNRLVNEIHKLAQIFSLSKNNQKLFDLIILQNPWFTKESILVAIDAIDLWLARGTLSLWIKRYGLDINKSSFSPKRVGIIMAGNIPLVGFHDLLAVFVTGHYAYIKQSQKDSILLRHCMENWFQKFPYLREKIKFVKKIENVDAVIATGSDNTSRYFKFYFSNIPRIIRRNRKSIAVITNDWHQDDYIELGKDIFTHFGLGCRNVSLIFTPSKKKLLRMIKAWGNYSSIINHTKYKNNYEYQKATLLLESKNHLDAGFILLQDINDFNAPIATINYQIYEETNASTQVGSLHQFIQSNKEQLQCIVSTQKDLISGEMSPYIVPPGMSQYPSLNDYADKVDTLSFLKSI